MLRTKLMMIVLVATGILSLNTWAVGDHTSDEGSSTSTRGTHVPANAGSGTVKTDIESKK